MKKFYKDLMSKGQSLNDIDNMDIHFWWELFYEHEATNVIENADEVPWL